MSQSHTTTTPSANRLSLKNPASHRLSLNKSAASNPVADNPAPSGSAPSGSAPSGSAPSGSAPSSPASNSPPPNTIGIFVLTFEATAADFPEYRHAHRTFAAAEIEAKRVLAMLEGRPPLPPIIDGPGCGRDGRRVYGNP